MSIVFPLYETSEDKSIAQQIIDDFEDEVDGFDSAIEANEHLLYVCAENYESEVQTEVMHTYIFKDHSTIDFKNRFYRVGGV